MPGEVEQLRAEIDRLKELLSDERTLSRKRYVTMIETKDKYDRLFIEAEQIADKARELSSQADDLVRSLRQS